MFIQKNFKIRYGATMTRGDNDNEKYGTIIDSLLSKFKIKIKLNNYIKNISRKTNYEIELKINRRYFILSIK